MAINTVSELRVYQVGDEEWWIATSAEHAIEQSSAMSEVPIADYEGDASLMSEANLNAFTYHDERSGNISGTEQVLRLQERGEWKPGPFAFASC